MNPTPGQADPSPSSQGEAGLHDASPQPRETDWRRTASAFAAAIVAGIVFGRTWPEAASGTKFVGDLIRWVLEAMAALTMLVSLAGAIMETPDGSVARPARWKGLQMLAIAVSGVYLIFCVAMRIRPGLAFPFNNPPGLPSPIGFDISQWQDLAKIPRVVASELNRSSWEMSLIIVTAMVVVMASVAGALPPSRRVRLQQRLATVRQTSLRWWGRTVVLAPLYAFFQAASCISHPAGMAFIAHQFGYIITSVILLAMLVGAASSFVDPEPSGIGRGALLRRIGPDVILAFGSGSTLIALPGLMAKLEALGIAPANVRLVLPLVHAFARVGALLPLVIASVVQAGASDPRDQFSGPSVLLIGLFALPLTPLPWVVTAVGIATLRFRATVLRYRALFLAALFLGAAIVMVLPEIDAPVHPARIPTLFSGWIFLSQAELVVMMAIISAPTRLFEAFEVAARNIAVIEPFRQLGPGAFDDTMATGLHWIVTMFTATADVVLAAIGVLMVAGLTGASAIDGRRPFEPREPS